MLLVSFARGKALLDFQLFQLDVFFLIQQGENGSENDRVVRAFSNSSREAQQQIRSRYSQGNGNQNAQKRVPSKFEMANIMNPKNKTWTCTSC